MGGLTGLSIFSPSVPIAGHSPRLFYAIMFERPPFSSTSSQISYRPGRAEILVPLPHPPISATIKSLSDSIYCHFVLLSAQAQPGIIFEHLSYQEQSFAESTPGLDHLNCVLFMYYASQIRLNQIEKQRNTSRIQRWLYLPRSRFEGWGSRYLVQ